ncbi:hypothetical protein L596_011578 [Steinernema carpocapsae]|uniref:THUMP domain-containing protein n=1 Tax=Steinernema carpocapsae TaxID=34508 RepID=A0A4U5NUT1_STECR|nr:hypothetical protein L596_011578 [Steinernema carpocapsae]
MTSEESKAINRGGGGRYWKPQSNGKWRKLDNCFESLEGLLFTCEGNEKRARMEVENLLKLYYDEVDEAKEDDKEMDAADALSQMKNKILKEKRYEWIQSGARNVILCRLKNTDISGIAEWFVNKCQSGNESRHLMRLYPVHDTIKFSKDTALGDLQKLCLKNLPAVLNAKSGEWPSYRIDLARRNTGDLISREDVYDVVGNVKEQQNLHNEVKLSEPDITLLFQIQKTTLLFSYAKDFDQRRKFSLRPPQAKQPKEAKTGSVDGQEVEEVKVESLEEAVLKKESQEAEVKEETLEA